MSEQKSFGLTKDNGSVVCQRCGLYFDPTSGSKVCPTCSKTKAKGYPINPEDGGRPWGGNTVRNSLIAFLVLAGILLIITAIAHGV